MQEAYKEAVQVREMEMANFVNIIKEKDKKISSLENDVANMQEAIENSMSTEAIENHEPSPTSVVTSVGLRNVRATRGRSGTHPRMPTSRTTGIVETQLNSKAPSTPRGRDKTPVARSDVKEGMPKQGFCWHSPTKSEISRD